MTFSKLKLEKTWKNYFFCNIVCRNFLHFVCNQLLMLNNISYISLMKMYSMFHLLVLNDFIQKLSYSIGFQNYLMQTALTKKCQLLVVQSKLVITFWGPLEEYIAQRSLPKFKLGNFLKKIVF